MKPYIHAKNSAKKYGGKVEDYLPIHNKMDSSKAAHADMRHRLVFHSAFGIYLMEDLFGSHFTNSDKAVVSVRDIAEDHVLEDLGKIPSLSDWLGEMELKTWMGGPIRRHKFVKMENFLVD
jgi:hypothetical protein